LWPSAAGQSLAAQWWQTHQRLQRACCPRADVERRRAHLGIRRVDFVFRVKYEANRDVVKALPRRRIFLGQQATKGVSFGVDQEAFDFEQSVAATEEAEVYAAVVQFLAGHCICAHESLWPW
jgi:hypothetical protein